MDGKTGAMHGALRLALAQINTCVGDLEGNTAMILDRIAEARGSGADVVVFPELAVTGYPPEDLLLKPSFLEGNLKALADIAAASGGITVICGFVDVESDIYNAAAVIHDGSLAGVHRKAFLPNYGVFDEHRYFRRGSATSVWRLGGPVFGVSVCEDMWYPNGPHHAQACAGAQILININASPFHSLKWMWRESMLGTRAVDSSAYVAYVNMVGGQDELVFDGHSLVIDPRGRTIARGRPFEEDLVMVDIEVGQAWHTRLADPRWRQGPDPTGVCGAASGNYPIGEVALQPGARARRPAIAPTDRRELERVEEVYKALVLGTRDYVRKNSFKRVVIGISGGIDSALTAAIAVDALGPASVTGISMPSQYTSDLSQSDAAQLVKSLGINLLTIPIQEVFETYRRELAPAIQSWRPAEQSKEDVTEENLQARIRGKCLMALSNKFGALVLTTGNKSEMATGYATLYGDMAGGFAVLKDVPKTLVYELARYRNAVSPVIPQSIIQRPPSAELKPNQTDQDTLPPYDILDPILQLYVEEDASPAQIAARGYPADVVERVVRMVDRNEYKRRQAPPGIKITPRAFGKDRRLPITNGFRE